MVKSFEDIRKKIDSENSQIINFIRMKHAEYIKEIRESDPDVKPRGIIQYTMDLFFFQN